MRSWKPGWVLPGPVSALFLVFFTVPGCGPLAARKATVPRQQAEIPIVLRSLSGGGERVLTPGKVARWPSFSNDSRRLAYFSDEFGSNDIFIIDLEQGHSIRLTSEPYQEDRPTWTPDGQRLIYSAYRNGNWSLYSTLKMPGLAQQVTMARSDETAPCFSRDGRYLAFQSNIRGNFDIWIMETETGRQRELTFDPADDGTPSISPDGKTVAFDSNRSGNWDIYLVPLAGGTPRRLTDDPADDCRPNWTPDGRFIIYASMERGKIMKIPVTGGEPETLVDLGLGRLDEWGFSSRSVSPDGKWLAYSKVVKPEVVPVKLEEKIPILTLEEGIRETTIRELEAGKKTLQVASVLGKRFGRELKLLRRVSLEPGGSVPPRQNKKDWLVYYIVQGKGTMIVDGDKAEVKAGDCVLTLGNQLHGLLNTGEEKLLFVLFKARSAR